MITIIYENCGDLIQEGIASEEELQVWLDKNNNKCVIVRGTFTLEDVS